jgi:CRISPR-associated protein Csx10
MQVQPFKITLLEEVVISERAANEGGHSSLDYLQGATFLGAIANRLYDQLSEQEAYEVFHSGKVRFGNALPLSEEEQLSYPMPLCWYKIKRDKYEGKMTLRNYQHDEFNKRFQPEQLRGNYISLGAIKPEHRITEILPRFRMKTAIDPEVGTARDSQLFGYSSLPPALEFFSRLEADDDIAPELFKRIVGLLRGELKLKLGRSRSAEYGAVEIKLSKQSEHPDERELPKATSQITLWLLADAALQDENGQPLLHPTAQSVGLPAHFQLDMGKTFVRSRRYAPFNAFRRRRELERVVLSMGSVLHFTSQENKDVDAATLQTIQERGIGLHRQAGLGRVWINPKILAAKTPHFDKLPRKRTETDTEQEETDKEDKDQAPDNPVFRYLDKHSAHLSDISEVEKCAKAWIEQLETLYDSAKKLSYVPPGVCPGPTATQWGRVMEMAKNATTVESLKQQLFVGEEAVCKKDDPQWTKRFFQKEQTKVTKVDDFRLWLKQKISDPKNEHKLLLQIVARFARLARDVADQQTKGNIT